MRLKLALVSLIATAVSAQDGEKLIKDSDCSSCHALDRQVVGPAYSAVAKQYAGQSDAPVGKLAAKIQRRRRRHDASSGSDGGAAHRHGEVDPVANRSAASSGQSDAKTYSYTLKDGTTVSLDFPLFMEGQAPKVTKEVFHGYQLYNSYCYRCHGTDASGSQLAPDLRHSLAVGMKQHDFLSVAMSGKKEQGMPAWAGFLSEDDVVHIFRYVKGRSLDLVSPGRPPSAQD